MADDDRPVAVNQTPQPREHGEAFADSPFSSVAPGRIWPTYPGPPDGVTDGMAPEPAELTPSRRGWNGKLAVVGAAAAVVAAVSSVVAASVVGAPTAAVPAQRPQPVIAPAVWSRVDSSLTSGLVVVSGGPGAEADGIVMTAEGLVATSSSRITGDLHPAADEFPLWVEADGQESLAASVVHTDAATDIAFVSAPGFVPSRIATPGTAVRVGDVLTVLDDQGGRHPILGIGVTVTAIDKTCSRAGSKAHPTGFRFSLDTATAEPGAALVRADGTVVGMYFGGNDATHHCAIPIADVVKAMRTR